MANGHGGQRNNAGRKSKRIKFPGQVNALDERLAAQLEKSTANLIKLANGGYKRKTEVWKVAGSMQVVRTEIVYDDKGNPKILRHLEPMFPDIEDQTALICIERRFEIAEPDRAANEYIIDRIAGRTGEMEPPEDTSSELSITKETRQKALEQTNKWRSKSQQQLASIRNPLTGQTISESESESGVSLNPEDLTTDEF